MFGLETGEFGSCAGAPEWASESEGRVFDTAAGMVAADALIAPGRCWSVPTLQGIPTDYQLFGGLPAAAQLGKTLLLAGIADARAWAKTGRDPFRFIEETLKKWVDARGGPEIATEFSLRLGLVCDLDPYGQEVGSEVGQEEMYLVIEPSSAGYVVLGPTLRLLEMVHPRLPVTFFDLFAGALNRWLRVYDHRDALERVQTLRDWYAGDPEAEQIELPDVEGATPSCLHKRCKPLKEQFVERLLGKTKDGTVRALIEGVLELNRTSRQAERPEIGAWAEERLTDSNPPLPVLLAVFEKHDPIEGCFDEDSQGMLECVPEPNAILPFRPGDVGSVRGAFRLLDVVCGVLRRSSRLIKLMMELTK